LPVEVIRDRIENYYKPYHRELNRIISSACNHFGQVWHINCHCMPSSSAPVVAAGPIIHPTLAKADLVIGDRDGTSCSPEFTHLVRDLFKQLGYRVTLNNPYKGVEIVKKFGKPYFAQHSLQLEINRGIYIDEETLEYTKDFKSLQEDLSKIFGQIKAYTESKLISFAAD